LYRRVGDTGGTEDGGSEDGDTGDPDPFLHNLKPDDQLDATTSMEFTRANTEKHREIGRVASGFAFKLCDVTNILELGLGLSSVCTCLASKAAKDVTSFLFAADLDKPTG